MNKFVLQSGDVHGMTIVWAAKSLLLLRMTCQTEKETKNTQYID